MNFTECGRWCVYTELLRFGNFEMDNLKARVLTRFSVFSCRELMLVELRKLMLYGCLQIMDDVHVQRVLIKKKQCRFD